MSNFKETNIRKEGITSKPDVKSESSEKRELKKHLNEHLEKSIYYGNSKDGKYKKRIYYGVSGVGMKNFKMNLQLFGNKKIKVSKNNDIVGDNPDKKILLEKEELTTGKHGYERSLKDIASRAWQINYKTGKINGPQGRWLPECERKVYEELAKLDTNKMKAGKEYSISIPKGTGEIIRPNKDYPSSKTPILERITREPADKAIVILQNGGKIHTFPIGSEHSAYNKSAPTIPQVEGKEKKS
ncbi:hypothetical protein RSJ42_07390 [Methanosarcina hadiensis]|uniref:hypothetical protein n=1 Tax=Methanosarcina hadiensis TaxID=3078083 RepID=UPI0039773F74